MAVERVEKEVASNQETTVPMSRRRLPVKVQSGFQEDFLQKGEKSPFKTLVVEMMISNVELLCYGIQSTQSLSQCKRLPS